MGDFEDILPFIPPYWDRYMHNGEINLIRSTTEYKNVEYDITRGVKAVDKVRSITRIQNIYDFGQFLMRSQIVCINNRNEQYYRVRRYVAIPKAYKDLAIKHNLDHRRLNMSPITFKSHIEFMNSNYLIFVVTILTNDPRKREIKPYNFTEYFIDYVVEI